MDLHPLQIENSIPNKPKQMRYKSMAHIMLVAINLGISNFYFGYCLAYISTMQFTEIVKIFTITMSPDIARGILTACIPIGAGIGGLLASKLIHIFSRRNLVLLINLIAVIAGCILYINNFIVLICMRLVQGICVGLYMSAVPCYIMEISPVEIQNTTAPFTQIFSSLGTTVAYLFYLILYMTLKGQQYQLLIWYLVIGFPFIPILIQTIVLLFIFPYQTPKYHLLHDQKKKAKELIAIFYKQAYVETVLHQKIQELNLAKTKQAVKLGKKQQKDLPFNQQEDIIVPKLRIANNPSQNSESSPVVQVDQPSTPKFALFAAMHCIILKQFTGIGAVVVYGGDITSTAAQNLRAIIPCILNVLIMLGSIVAIFILHKFKKKTLLQSGTVVLALSLLLITVGFFILKSFHNAAFILIITGLVIFTFTFGLTYGAIIWSYVSQIVQPSYDILATTMTWIFASIVLILFPILKNVYLGGDPSTLFLFFLIWITVSYFINQKILVQTTDKNENEIRREYREMKCTLVPCFCRKKPVTDEIKQNQLFDYHSIQLKLAKLKSKREGKELHNQNIKTESQQSEIFQEKPIEFPCCQQRATQHFESTLDQLNSSKDNQPQNKDENMDKD